MCECSFSNMFSPKRFTDVIFLWPYFIDGCVIHGGCSLVWWWWNAFIRLTKRNWRSSSWIIRLEYQSSSSPFYSNISPYTSSILMKLDFSIVVCWVLLISLSCIFGNTLFKSELQMQKLCYCLCRHDFKNEGISDQLNDVVDVFHTFFGVASITFQWV